MSQRDHGGGLDAAVARWGGTRGDWLDLSTGINPVPYPVGTVSDAAWNGLPDSGAMERLLDSARAFWQVPDHLDILAANGASALIARMPQITGQSSVYIPTPTYNEHAAAFDAAGVPSGGPEADVHVYVHPNNPDGRLTKPRDIPTTKTVIIDESFCDVLPEQSHLGTDMPDTCVVLKSFGKFWGLAGVRLGFLIAAPDLIAQMKAQQEPWSVNGPALEIGARALRDTAWADETRARLAQDALRLDQLMGNANAKLVGGTDLFRLYEVDSATDWQNRLASAHIWSRIFPYSDRWIRLGLPAPDQWAHLQEAL